MSITVAIGLLSGKTATVQAGLDEEVGTLKRQELESAEGDFWTPRDAFWMSACRSSAPGCRGGCRKVIYFRDPTST